MSRIKLDLPDVFVFSTSVKVRVSDLNYGNHLSNDVYLAYLHEARLQFFKSMDYSEMNLAGSAVIMGDSVIVYKAECFYGDEIKIEVMASNFSKRSFDLFYKMSKTNDNELLVAEAKTGMVCYDYLNKKTMNVPIEFIEKVNALLL
ncbi:MAG: acyl-CoA thioesterase [Bacteroidia bacterium]